MLLPVSSVLLAPTALALVCLPPVSAHSVALVFIPQYQVLKVCPLVQTVWLARMALVWAAQHARRVASDRTPLLLLLPMLPIVFHVLLVPTALAVA